MVDRVRDRMANMVDDAIVIGTGGRRVMKELSLCLGSDSYIYIYMRSNPTGCHWLRCAHQ